MLQGIERAARGAGRAWRRARATRAALLACGVAFGGAAATALALEILVPGGLTVPHLGWLAAWLLVVPAAAVAAAARPIPPTLAASELDRRAGLADRLGTALEFASDPSPMAAVQREDAAAAAFTATPAAAFPVAFGGRPVATLAVLAALLLLVAGASLTWRLGPAPPAVAEEPSAADDLLAMIDRERDRLDELGDKEAVRLLTDLERTIRIIQAREEELRDRVERRKRDPLPDAEEDVPEPDLPEPEVADASDPSHDLITAEDLARLEEETLAQLQMTDAEEAELLSSLFDHTRTASRLSKEFEEHSHHEHEVANEARDLGEGYDPGTDFESAWGGARDPMESAFGEQTGMDTPQDPTQDAQEVLRRDLTPEGMAEHDAGHDQGESFNQFLKEFVKDVREIVKDAAVGGGSKKPGEKKGREVTVDTGDGVADKAPKMEESGFEEMGDVKRGGDADAPETMAGEGAPPSDAEVSGKGRKGEVTDDMVAMKGKPQGGTEAGASGAGQGNPNATGGLAALLQKVVDPMAGAGPLERALSQLAEGRLPPEQRDAVFDRIARHKVQAGPASEADDVVVDYFAEAEELMVSNRDALPPLFRDYAQSYFDAIRPGAE